MPRPVRAYIGLGSNLDDPVARVVRALSSLRATSGLHRVRGSSLYISKPMGPPDQPDFVNAVAALDTELAPEALLDVLQAHERAQDRQRGRHWGPRTLDLDLLLYGAGAVRTGRLTVPHPGLHERAFVLYPLAELAPGLRVPGHGALEALLAACPPDGLLRRCEDGTTVAVTHA